MKTIGMRHLIKAIHLVGDKLIHNAVTAQTRVFNIIGTIIISPGVPGMIYISKVMPKEAIISPPRIAHIVLYKPIFLPFFSGIDNFARKLEKYLVNFFLCKM